MARPRDTQHARVWKIPDFIRRAAVPLRPGGRHPFSIKSKLAPSPLREIRLLRQAS
jgi:hypothetical protein